MKTIVLISCVKQKRSGLWKAKDLYTSNLFRKNLAYAHFLKPDKIFILSAKYGLTHPDENIESYEMTLNSFRKNELIEWSKATLQQIKNNADSEKDRFIFLAGEKYRKFLIPYLTHYEIPLKGLTIGKQLQFLSEKMK